MTAWSCLITDGSGRTPETKRLVTELAAHNDVLAVFVYDPLEADLPDIGRAVLADGERQIEVDIPAAELRRRFAAEFRRVARADRALRRCTRDSRAADPHRPRSRPPQLRALIGRPHERRAA